MCEKERGLEHEREWKLPFFKGYFLVMHPAPIAVAHTTMLPFTPPGDPLSAALLNEVDSALLVSIYIDDPAEETNYYRLTIHYEGTKSFVTPLPLQLSSR